MPGTVLLLYRYEWPVVILPESVLCEWQYSLNAESPCPTYNNKCEALFYIIYDWGQIAMRPEM